jgi:hypothetical protein
VTAGQVPTPGESLVFDPHIDDLNSVRREISVVAKELAYEPFGIQSTRRLWVTSFPLQKPQFVNTLQLRLLGCRRAFLIETRPRAVCRSLGFPLTALELPSLSLRGEFLLNPLRHTLALRTQESDGPTIKLSIDVQDVDHLGRAFWREDGPR